MERHLSLLIIATLFKLFASTKVGLLLSSLWIISIIWENPDNKPIICQYCITKDFSWGNKYLFGGINLFCIYCLPCACLHLVQFFDNWFDTFFPSCKTKITVQCLEAVHRCCVVSEHLSYKWCGTFGYCKRLQCVQFFRNSLKLLAHCFLCAVKILCTFMYMSRYQS